MRCTGSQTNRWRRGRCTVGRSGSVLI
jgi:hypothetical protein